MDEDEQLMYEDKIDRYLRGRADREERRAIEERRRTDEAFAEALERDEAIVAGLRAEGDRALKDRLRRVEAANPYRPARLRHLTPGRWLAVAASVAVVLVAGWWLLSRPGLPVDTARLLAESFAPYPNRAYNLTKGDTPADPRAQAYAAYEAGEYARAVAAFAESTAAETADDFYRANALLALDRPAEALPLFQELARQPDFALAPHSRWYAALSLLALDRRAEARAVLQTITTEPEHPFRAEASELLRRLE